MRNLIIAALAATACLGCTAQTKDQGGSPTETGTTNSGVYREGRFAKAAIDIVACTSFGAHTRNPGMFFEIGGGGGAAGDYSVVASHTKDGDAIWMFIANDAGPGSSDVTLRGTGASAAALDEVWRIVEFCETYKPG